MGSGYNELRNGALSRAIKAAVGDEDPSAGLERYSESLVAVLDLWSQPEWALPRGETLWTVFRTQAAVVGQVGFVGIRNPAGSNLLCVIEEWFTDSAGFVETSLTTSAAGVAASGTTFGRDARDRTAFGGGHAILFIQGSEAAASRLGPISPIISGTRSITRFPIVLRPDSEAVLYNTVNNTAMNVAIWGRSRNIGLERGLT